MSGYLRVPEEELDFDDNQVFHYQGIPFTGVAYEDDPETGVSEVTYVDGMQEGPARDWYRSGALKSEAVFFRGALHGRHRKFREDGGIEFEEVREYGILVRSSVFDKAGHVVERFELAEEDPNFALLVKWRKAESER